VDDDVAALVRADRLLEAAQVTSARGDARGASALFERACDWRNAAREALRAGDGPRGLELALRADDEALARDAVTNLAGDATTAERTAASLFAHGRPDWAARVLEAASRDLDAARAWERAGEMARAATLFERAREPAQAARVLELALRRDPGDAEAALALGSLLERFGKDEASLRVLQRVPASSSMRREALRVMLGPLHRMGLTAAAREAASELSALAPRDATEPSRAAWPARSAWLRGRYEVVRQVASSANARVLEARDRARGERVALKVYAAGDGAGTPRSAFDRLERDLRSLRALDHPAIVPLRDVEAAESIVVMSWMDGGDLAQALAKDALAPARAIEIAVAVLSALGEAHRIGIVHRDVKPTNVLFDAAGATHLSDFGAAHAADASATVTAGDFGGLTYQSPEQREGRGITAQSDLFSVGALLSEILTGSALGNEPPSSRHSGLDARHDRIVASLRAQSPEQRPADAFEALELLRSLPWPGTATGATGLDGRASTSERPDERRLQAAPDGAFIDMWTGRAVECVPLSDAVVARAQLFAAVDDGTLQQVLRIDREGGCVWLAACAAPLDRPLTRAEQARVRAALEAFVAGGGERSSLDTEGLGVSGDGAVVLRF